MKRKITRPMIAPLIGPINQVWQAIGADVMSEDSDISNDEAIECCIDRFEVHADAGSIAVLKQAVTDYGTNALIAALSTYVKLV